MIKGVVGLYYQKQTKDFTQDAPSPGLNDFCALPMPAALVARLPIADLNPVFPTVNRYVVGSFPNVFQSVVPSGPQAVRRIRGIDLQPQLSSWT